MIKKLLALALGAALLTGLLAGCGGGSAASPAPSGEGDKISVVATIFPEYDWVREVLGDRAEGAEVTLLLRNGVDMHSFQPSVDDIVTISNCDLFLYVGGESDAWVRDALADAVNKDMEVVSLMDVLGSAVVEEEIVDGMEHEHDEDDDHEDEGPEYDEHVWLSLKNAAVVCREIAARLGKLDAANSDAYAQNAEAYIEKLNALDGKYAAAVDAAAGKTVLFGDRFPFRYMTDDYDLDYYAAFVGCSAETEASFETVVFLAGKVDELGLPAVLTIETSDGKLAQTIVDNTRAKSAKILVMDSLQSVTSKDVENGETYLGVMEKNLEALTEALG